MVDVVGWNHWTRKCFGSGVSNIANNASYAGNSEISFTANLLPLGSYYRNDTFH